jgi:hypothetical protein
MPTQNYQKHPPFCTCAECQKAHARGKDPKRERARKGQIERSRRQRELAQLFENLSVPPDPHEIDEEGSIDEINKDDQESGNRLDDPS